MEKQKNLAAEFRYKLTSMMNEIYLYVQPTQIDKIMAIEMEQRERAKDLLHETIRQFEGNEDGSWTFSQL